MCKLPCYYSQTMLTGRKVVDIKKKFVEKHRRKLRLFPASKIRHTMSKTQVRHVYKLPFFFKRYIVNIRNVCDRATSFNKLLIILYSNNRTKVAPNQSDAHKTHNNK